MTSWWQKKKKQQKKKRKQASTTISRVHHHDNISRSPAKKTEEQKIYPVNLSASGEELSAFQVLVGTLAAIINRVYQLLVGRWSRGTARVRLVKQILIMFILTSVELVEKRRGWVVVKGLDRCSCCKQKKIPLT